MDKTFKNHRVNAQTIIISHADLNIRLLEVPTYPHNHFHLKVHRPVIEVLCSFMQDPYKLLIFQLHECLFNQVHVLMMEVLIALRTHSSVHDLLV